jgi:pectate lyase
VRAFLLVALCTGAAAAQPAFPGAEGFGARATGGRGGQVLKVTTLASSGTGSFQAALDASGPRIIVFDVSGVITGDLEIPHGDVTIAGQTAPGAGITLNGRLFLYRDYDQGADNVIIRHLRIRPPLGNGGDGAQYDGIQGGLNTTRIILDHISVCCGVDETIDLYTASGVTLQWSTVEESQIEGHPEGLHNYGFINGPDGDRVSVHHTLFAGHQNRNPAIANGPSEVRNVVAYNVRHGFIHHNPAAGGFDLVGNTYKQGPENTLIPFYLDDETPGDASLTYFISGTYVDDPGELTGPLDNPWTSPYVDGVCSYDCPEATYRVTTPHDFSGEAGHIAVTTQDAQEAYELVLGRAGAFPRDAITLRVVQETRDRTGDWGPEVPDDLLEGLSPGTPAADTDGDGMPDAWELGHGLDPSLGTDHRTVTATGYTAIEDYINGLAEALVGGGGPCTDDCPPPLDAGLPSDGGTGQVGDGGGCGCQAGGDGVTGDAAWLLILLGLVALRRRAG